MQPSGPSCVQFLARKDVQTAMAFPVSHSTPVKREALSPESPVPEQARENTPVKLEPDYSVPKNEYDDSDEGFSGNNMPVAASPHPAPAPAKANNTEEPPAIDDLPGIAAALTKKMNKISDLDERERACRAGVERIVVEVRALEHGAADLLQAGKAKWLLTRISTLSGQKAIMQMILMKVEERKRRRQARMRRLRREEQRRNEREAEVKRQLETKRQSNKQQLRSQSALKTQVPHLDLTAAPTPGPEKEVQVLVNTKPEIKMEPNIKIEEE